MYQGVIMAGFGGQGVVSGGILMTYSGMIDGKHVTFFPAYGAEMRGGTANCSVVISSEEIASPIVSFPDTILVMNEPSLAKFEPTLKSDGLMFLNTSLVESRSDRDDIETIEVPANDIAADLGNIKCANMVMIGAYMKKTGAIDLDVIKNSIGKVYVRANEAILKMNSAAIDRGAALVK